MLAIARLAVVALVACGCSAPRDAWVELGPAGQIVRAVVDGDDACPPLRVGGTPILMQERAAPDADFPVRVCEATIAFGSGPIRVGGQALPTPTLTPKRIAVFADTGCRLKTGHALQACNDPAAWPLARIADSIRAYEPDLVIHDGDLIYREMPCPADGGVDCGGSPYGDKLATWDADVFSPMHALLPSVPWLFVRGCHETCDRAGHGWFRFLDAQPRPPTGCADFTPPFALPTTPQLLVLDSAMAIDASAPPDLVMNYAMQLDALAGLAHDGAWLTTHKPVWGYRWDGTKLSLIDQTLQQAMSMSMSPSLLSTVAQLVFGHIHLFELLGFANGRPPAIVSGAGATELDPDIPVPLVGRDAGGDTVAVAEARAELGFVTLEPCDPGWMLTFRDVDGNALVNCTLAGASVSCGP